MEQGENDKVEGMNEVSDGESFIEIQINKQSTGLMSISSSSSSSPSTTNVNEMHGAAIFSSASSCFSAYSSVMRLMMKLGCVSIVGVIREKMNVGEKWVLKVIHGRRRNKTSIQYYCEGVSTKHHSEEMTLTEDSIKAAIAYCNASSSLSPLQT